MTGCIKDIFEEYFKQKYFGTLALMSPPNMAMSASERAIRLIWGDYWFFLKSYNMPFFTLRKILRHYVLFENLFVCLNVGCLTVSIACRYRVSLLSSAWEKDIKEKVYVVAAVGVWCWALYRC